MSLKRQMDYSLASYLSRLTKWEQWVHTTKFFQEQIGSESLPKPKSGSRTHFRIVLGSHTESLSGLAIPQINADLGEWTTMEDYSHGDVFLTVDTTEHPNDWGSGDPGYYDTNKLRIYWMAQSGVNIIGLHNIVPYWDSRIIIHVRDNATGAMTHAWQNSCHDMPDAENCGDPHQEANYFTVWSGNQFSYAEYNDNLRSRTPPQWTYHTDWRLKNLIMWLEPVSRQPQPIPKPMVGHEDFIYYDDQRNFDGTDNIYNAALRNLNTSLVFQYWQDGMPRPAVPT